VRAGINLSNFLLVSGQNTDGTPASVSPDLARHIAAILDVPCQFVAFEKPGQLADAATDDVWDICNIAHEPERARLMDFSQPYVLIDAHFLVRADSIEQSHDLFLRGKADVLASLKPRLQMELAAGQHRMIAPRFTAIKQAVGIKKTDPAVLQFLNDLIAATIKDRFIETSLAAHGVADKLSLPEPAG
jgi:polar amino acid transport system substrate-binding protein